MTWLLDTFWFINQSENSFRMLTGSRSLHLKCHCSFINIGLHKQLGLENSRLDNSSNQSLEWGWFENTGGTFQPFYFHTSWISLARLTRNHYQLKHSIMAFWRTFACIWSIKGLSRFMQLYLWYHYNDIPWSRELQFNRIFTVR